MNQPIAEISKETFWALIAQAKEYPSGPGEWLMEIGRATCRDRVWLKV